MSDNAEVPEQVDPQVITGFLREGTSALRRGAFDDAEAALRRALEGAPRNAGATILLAHALRGKGNLDGALECYRSATEFEPGWSMVWQGMAEVLREMSRLDEAVRAFREALTLDDLNASAAIGLARVLSEQGDVVAAADELDTYLQLAKVQRSELDRGIAAAEALLDEFAIPQR